MPNAARVAALRRWLGLDGVPRWAAILLFALLVFRVLYHLTYISEVPFAWATISDGAVYEQAARDIASHPPLGTKPFYLQGAYAYFMAIGMTIAPLGLLPQIAAAFAGLLMFHRGALRLLGPRGAVAATIVLLAYPGLAFYENKFLSAELGVLCDISMIWALGWAKDRGTLVTFLVMGMTCGLAILARPNLVVAVPFAMGAAIELARRPSDTTRPHAWTAAGAVAVGVVLALAPMAARNLVVTGYPDVQPIHGGGTSFYIGNNPKSRGVWNDAGLLSARLGAEERELGDALQIHETTERAQARAVGRELYGRAFAWIRENPGDFVALELRKVWVMVGNDELMQDYDYWGERELIWFAHRVGIPFGSLLGLGLAGFIALRRDRQRPPRLRNAISWMCAGQVVAIAAANILFFTSSQHRLPLAVPMALLAGVAVDRWRADGVGALPVWATALVLAVAAQGFWPRTNLRAPHPVHYYNLAVVQDDAGDPRAALRSLDVAVAQRPENPLFRLRRAHLRLRLTDLGGAREDLDHLEDLEGAPEWVYEAAAEEAVRLELAVRLARQTR